MMRDFWILGHLTFLTFILLTGCTNHQINKEKGIPRSVQLFDFNWKFHYGDVKNGEMPSFDDSQWRKVDLPHDWSIEDLPGTDSPFNPEAIAGIDGGYLVGGTSWYRKKFSIPRSDTNKKIYIEFGGVYMNADIWVNGNHIGNYPNGYMSFYYNITEFIHFDKENVIAVQVKNEGKNSRWYSGSGIYRHVNLITVNPQHIAQWGTFISTPLVSSDQATVLVENQIVNSAKGAIDLSVVTTIYDEKDNEVGKHDYEIDILEEKEKKILQEIKISEPELWFLKSPYLYTAVTELKKDSEVLDRIETNFGIRTIEFSTDGFFLNGENTLLKGGCMHHGNGLLGAAAYDRAEERRVEIMKENGYNAIRCSHNPPSKAFLDACDRHGILVIVEAFDMWQQEKRPQDYHLYFDEHWQEDLKNMIYRDRNHPSVIMWSTGNEIPERATPEGIETSKMLANFVRKLDSTRPVTAAVHGLKPDKDPYFATLDIAGYNYAVAGDHWQKDIYAQDHKRVPDRIIYCSESYPLAAFGSWMAAKKYPFVIGDFVWTSFDYLGEASIGWKGYPQEGSFYPWNHAFCGDIDICGFKRPQSYYRDVLWNNGKQLSIFVKPPTPSFQVNENRANWSKWHWHDVVDDWNWRGYEGKKLEVNVYSGHEEVELFLNRKSLGKKSTNEQNEWIAKWDVPFEPGTLKAVAYSDGNVVGNHELTTTTAPVAIKLKPDRNTLIADKQDLSYITVELLDEDGNRSITADHPIHFEIEGPGEILAVGSSNPKSVESFQRPQRKAYKGRCLVIVKSSDKPGKIIIKATSGSLPLAATHIISTQ